MRMTDPQIREALFTYLEGLYPKLRILEEKEMGRSRADLLVITEDSFLGFEIKSDFDSYARLASQVRDYSKYCDLCWVVVGVSHGAHVDEHVPESWGIVTVSWDINGVHVAQTRSPSQNKKVKPALQYSLLWQSELRNILRVSGLPKYTGKSRKFIIEKLMDKLPPEKLKLLVCDELFERDYTLLDKE